MAAASNYANKPKTAVDRSGLPGSGMGITKAGMGGPPPGATKRMFPNYTPPKAPAPDPRDVDPYYWQNVQALRQQHTLDKGQLLTEQGKATADYSMERDRMGKDYTRSLRDLAESLAGTGAMYSGSHRYDKTKMGQDYMENRGRLDSDYDYARKQRSFQSYTLDNALNQDLSTELQAAHDRFNQSMLDTNANADPLNKTKGKKGKQPGPNGRGTGGVEVPEDYKPLGARIRTRNRQIKTLRRKIENTDNPRREEMLRERLREARRRRNQLVRKAKKKNGKNN